MRLKKLVAGAVAGTALLGTIAVAAPAGASGTTPPSIVEVVASSAADNPGGARTDRNWNDFDILLAAVQDLGLAGTVAGLTNATVYAPADASFRGLVADLTNQSPFALSEQQVLDTLLAVAATPDLNGTGISGADALRQTVLYHVDPDRRARTIGGVAFGPNLTMANSVGTSTIDPYWFFVFGLKDGDTNDLDPFWAGRTVQASNGTIHVIAGVLRPLDFKVLFPSD